MSWIKADYRFDIRGDTFYVTYKQMLTTPVFKALCGRTDPNELETLVVKLIEGMRPELKGCVVWAMDYDIDTQRWKFSVSHGSLPRETFDTRREARPLDPAYESELVGVLK